ncbi:restriction endonuclease subunit S [Algoriphagus namhaensis]
MSEKRNVPRLRFPEFKEGFELPRLSKIANVYDGTHQTPKYTTSGVPFVSVENIRDLKATDKFISLEAFEKGFKTKPKKGDILMTRITAGVIGDTAIVEDNHPLGYYVSLALIRIKTETSVRFLNFALATNHFKRELNRRIIHVAFPKKINLGEIGQCTLPVATSLPEQQKIAEFLTAVDQRIELLQAKKEKLEAYKKGVMQKIFSQQLRFKADDGSEFPDWEERKLGEIGNFYGGGTPDSTKEHLWNGDMPWVSSSDIFEESIFKVSKTRFITEMAISESATKKIPPKSVLIVTRVGVGKIAYSEESVCTSQDFTSLSPFSEYNAVFLAYYLTFNSTKIKSLGQGTSIKGVTLDDLKNLRMGIPSEEEQTKIVQFLTSLDSALDNLNQQINQTQTWKKGLLQRMFV